MKIEIQNKYSPLISVIVPVYNAESTLRQCVDSILAQEYQDFELLLIDDGSKDYSPAICNEYAQKDQRVKVFHKENGGVSSARNVGLDNVKGEWITFIDADDYITTGYFEDVTQHQEDVLFIGYQAIKDGTIVGGCTSQQLNELNSLRVFLNSYLINSIIRSPWAKFYKRSLIGNLRFLSDMKIGEDAWFVFRYLSKCKSYAVLSDSEYIVRVADEPDEVKYSITVDYAVQSLQYLQDAFNRLVIAHGLDKALFHSYIGYFKRISKADWEKNREKWYCNQDIKSLYDYVWPALSVKQKLRLTIAKVLRR